MLYQITYQIIQITVLQPITNLMGDNYVLKLKPSNHVTVHKNTLVWFPYVPFTLSMSVTRLQTKSHDSQSHNITE